MSTVMRSARGASAFTNLDYLPSRPMDEASLTLSTQEAVPQRTWPQLIDDLLGLRWQVGSFLPTGGNASGNSGHRRVQRHSVFGVADAPSILRDRGSQSVRGGSSFSVEREIRME
jgi:hypothetical protein